MDLLYKIALTFIEGIGPITARKLVSYLGSPQEVFNQPKAKLKKIPGIGEYLAENIVKSTALKKAEKEIKIIEEKKIVPVFYLDENYPENLKHFDDSPLILYLSNQFDFKNKIFISVVGTRKPTEYGKSNCQKLILDLKEAGIEAVIISGLAYGIDVCAHKTALDAGFETIAVLGHGFYTLYPKYHKSIASKIKNQGVLLTEYPFYQKIEAQNFVKRNRIIAALGDSLVVVQTAKKGGSLITAEFAVDYGKPIYTFPGQVNDEKMKGCNYLIKTNRAALIENADDLIYEMGLKRKQKIIQNNSLFQTFSDDEMKIIDLLKSQEQINIDVIAYKLNMPINKVLTLLFNLEMNGIVKSLPGRMYTLTY